MHDFEKKVYSSGRDKTPEVKYNRIVENRTFLVHSWHSLRWLGRSCGGKEDTVNNERSEERTDVALVPWAKSQWTAADSKTSFVFSG